MSVIVQKFGGTSLADAGRIHEAAQWAVRAKLMNHHVVVVASAMGHATDDLLALAHSVNPRPSTRELDMLLTTGEQVSGALMAMAVQAAGHAAVSLNAAQIGLVTDSAHTSARVQRISRTRIERELEAGNIVIVAGFQGIDCSGEMTTLGRGASDTTAVALAAALGADLCEIHTDVDGVHTADPRFIATAGKIDEISYDDMLAMSRAGAGVIHPVAVEFGKYFDVPIHIRGSGRDVPGTMVVRETNVADASSAGGVVLKERLAMVRLLGLDGGLETAARVLSEIAKRDIVIDGVMQNAIEQHEHTNLGFFISADDAAALRPVCEELLKTPGTGDVEIVTGWSKVSVIGFPRHGRTGLASTVFVALAQERVQAANVSLSETGVACFIRENDGPGTLRAIHRGLGLDDGETARTKSRAGASAVL